MPSASRVSPLERLSSELEAAAAPLGPVGWSTDRLRALLGRAEFRAFSVEGCVAPRVCSASCVVSGESARVAWIRPLRSRGGALGPGAWIVGRALPVGPGRWVFIGRPVVVGRGPRVAALSSLIRSMRAPRGEFWRVHGVVILRAARASATLRGPVRQPTAV